MINRLSIEELKEILKIDSQKPCSDHSDMDCILCILEEVERRERDKINYGLTDVDAAWASFQKNYRPIIGDGKSLYEDNDVSD